MKRILQMFVFALLVPALSFAQLNLQNAATVSLTKTEPITVKQLKSEVAKIESQAKRQLSTAERRQVLDVMINTRLAVQAAERDKLALTENELNQQLLQARSALKAQLGRDATDKEFEDAVKAETGLLLVDFKEEMRRQLTVQKYLMNKKRPLFDAIKPPTEAEIVSMYELSKSKLVRPDTVRFSMIHVPRGQSPEDIKKAKAFADGLSAEINTNASKFDEVALRSQKTNSGYQAGDGGYLPRSAEAVRVVGSDFLNAVFSLKVGEVSRVLENPRGFQIVKVTELYAQSTLSLNDPYQLENKSVGTVRDYIGNTLYQQRQQKVVEEATQELVSELRAGKPYKIFEDNLNW